MNLAPLLAVFLLWATINLSQSLECVTDDEYESEIGKLSCDLTHLKRKVRRGLENNSRDCCRTTATSDLKPASCVDVKNHNENNGVRTLTINNRDIKVFCDQQAQGGGWTVIQRRDNGSVDFYRTWEEYTIGFGDLTGEFWLGLDKLHQLTAFQPHRLRVDMETFSGDKYYAEYESFGIGGPGGNYRLYVSGYNGTAGDSLDHHKNKPFSTHDADHDSYDANCAVIYHGAWWYGSCHYSNLNGMYKQADEDASDAKGVDWRGIYGRYTSLKAVEMKMRPSDYRPQTNAQ